MLNKFFRDLAGRLTLRPARALASVGVSPNALTVFGFIVTSASAGLIATGRLFAGGLVLVAGGLFDMIDGAVAKVASRITRGGAFLDSTIDRLSDAVLFLAIFWQYATRGAVWSVTVGTEVPSSQIELPLGLWGDEGRAGAILAISALVLGYLVSYIKARAEGLGFDCSVGLAERPERIVLPAAGLLFDQLIPALAVLVTLSVLTAAQRFVYVWKQAREASPGRP